MTQAGAEPPKTIDDTLNIVAGALADELDELVETMLVRMRSQAPGFDTASRPELVSALRASCYGNTRVALEALRFERVPPRFPPAEAMTMARATARADIALEPLLRTYRVGHAVVLERFLVLVDDLDVGPVQRRNATLVGSKFLFEYVDHVVGQVAEEYVAERQRTERSSTQRRVQLVRDVLAGATVDSTELGYNLEQEHIALIVSGTRAESAVRDLARRLDRGVLTVAMTDDEVWAWLGSPRRSERHERIDFGPTPDRARFVVGEPAWGIDGFRGSHEQAVATWRVAVRVQQPVTRYDDVTLEAALLYDIPAARRLVEHELGELGADDPRTTLLRETLDTYLRCGLTAATTATALCVTDRTVAYRIHRVEELIGRRVVDRPSELAAAVRLQRVLSSPAQST